MTRDPISLEKKKPDQKSDKNRQNDSKAVIFQ